jgi:hypothetical protein
MHLSIDPPPQAARAIQGNVKVGIGLVGRDPVVGVEESDAVDDGGYRRTDAAEKGAGMEEEAVALQSAGQLLL